MLPKKSSGGIRPLSQNMACHSVWPGWYMAEVCSTNPAPPGLNLQGVEPPIPPHAETLPLYPLFTFLPQKKSYFCQWPSSFGQCSLQHWQGGAGCCATCTVYLPGVTTCLTARLYPLLPVQGSLHSQLIPNVGLHSLACIKIYFNIFGIIFDEVHDEVHCLPIIFQ